MRGPAVAGAAVAVMMAAVPAPAATSTSTFAVTANVVATCTVSAAPLAFGNYTPGGGTVTASTTVRVACANGTLFLVLLNGGSTAGGTVAQRLMANGASTLQYNLYTSTSYTTLWGDGTSGSSIGFGFGSGFSTPSTMTVYGQLPDNAANRTATAGTYTDTILVSVYY